MNYKFILALDPSGSYNEGKGTTGWCVMDSKFNIIKIDSLTAKEYDSMEAYWEAHLNIIDLHKNLFKDIAVVIEDYLLYGTKANEQINSRMETPKLIGVLQHYCWSLKIPYFMQLASEVKLRWSDEVLAYKKIFNKEGRHYKLTVNNKIVNKHCKDSIRHAMHFMSFKNK